MSTVFLAEAWCVGGEASAVRKGGEKARWRYRSLYWYIRDLVVAEVRCVATLLARA